MSSRVRLVPELSELQKARNEEKRQQALGEWAKTKSEIERTYEPKSDKLEGKPQFAMLKSLLV